MLIFTTRRQKRQVSIAGFCSLNDLLRALLADVFNFQALREYWAQRNRAQIGRTNARKARAVLKSKAHLAEFTKELVDTKKEEQAEEEEKDCGGNTEIDERIQRRLEEALRNALKNNQMAVELQKRA